MTNTSGTKCPHCEKKDKHNIMISNFKSKDFVTDPDENGEIEVHVPKLDKMLKIKPRTYFEELEFKKSGNKKLIEEMEESEKSMDLLLEIGGLILMNEAVKAKAALFQKQKSDGNKQK